MKCEPANPKASEIVNVWQETVPIRFGAIDKSDRLTLDGAFRFFQEAAISHAENLGVGREAMAATDRGWVLSRMTVAVNRRPDYCETVNVRSWPCLFEKLFAIRDYEITGSDGAAAISGRSAWLVVDMEKRRPLRPQVLSEFLPANEGLAAFAPEANAVNGLAERTGLQKTAEKKALYTDIDYNGHVNNVSYVRWIEDCLDMALLENADKMRIDINYLNEVLAGETVEIFSASLLADEKADALHAFAFEGRKTEVNTAAFRAELRLW